MLEDLSDTSPILFDVGVDDPTSTKAERRKARRQTRTARQMKRTPKPIEARSPNQVKYIKSLEENELTISIGPAGVGKTYVPARIYGSWLASGRISKLYVARPNVAKKKHENGFLPGTLEEKTAPWLVPIFEGIKDSMGPAQFEQFRKSKAIEEVPFEFIQGRTFRDACAIIDEAENLDMDDLHITLTRQGEGLHMVICGDVLQARIPDSGLGVIAEMVTSFQLKNVGMVEFDEEDVVRSDQAKQWVMAFRQYWKRNPQFSSPAKPVLVQNFNTTNYNRDAVVTPFGSASETPAFMRG